MQTTMRNQATQQSQLLQRTAAVSALALSSLALVLTGCGTGLSGANAAGGAGSTPVGKAIHGHVHGGQNPVSGSTVQLYEIAVGSSSTAAIPLGTPATTDINGNFNLTGTYTCDTNGMVYLLSSGGNPGLVSSGTINNTAITLSAALGSCATLQANAATTFIVVNEVTTVATAYALAGYMTTYLNAGYPGYATTYPNALTSLTNAFNTANVLVNTSGGYANSSVTGITLPATFINSLANLMSACINSASSTSTACSGIFAAATPSGGTAPTDVMTALINIAHNPTLPIGTAYNNYVPTVPPFAPALVNLPNDMTMPIIYSGNGIIVPYSVAIDASGNAWIANEGGNDVTEITPSGTFPSGSTGYSSTSIVGPQSIAIDNSGNIWLANTGANNVLKLNSSTGAVAATLTAGISGPVALAVDASSTPKLWVSNFDSSSIAAFTISTSAAVSGSPFSNTALANPTGISIDGSNNILVSNSYNGGIAAFTNAGVFKNAYTDGLSIAPGGIAVDIASTKNIYTASTGINAVDQYSSAFAATATPFSGGALTMPLGIAVDGGGTVWTVNGTSSATLSAFNNTGTSLFSTTGVGSLNLPVSVAIDGAGNLWTTDAGDNTVTEFVGLATPTVTPMVANFIYY
jgi:sugar lactone lactonase YvrE